MVGQRRRARFVFGDRVVQLRDQSLDERDLLLRHAEPAHRLAKPFLLLGVGDGVTALGGDLAPGQLGPCVHDVFAAPLDLRLPVAELVAFQPVAHPPQFHIDARERVPPLLDEVDHREAEVPQGFDRQHSRGLAHGAVSSLSRGVTCSGKKDKTKRPARDPGGVATSADRLIDRWALLRLNLNAAASIPQVVRLFGAGTEYAGWWSRRTA